MLQRNQKHISTKILTFVSVAMSRQVRPGAFIMMKCGLVAGGAGSDVADGSEGRVYTMCV